MDVSDIQTILNEGVRAELNIRNKNELNSFCVTLALDQEEHTGEYLLSLLCLLVEDYWVRGQTFYFNINGCKDAYKLECTPKFNQTGSGILKFNGIPHPWRHTSTSRRNGTTPCEENLENDEFYAEFYEFLISPVKESQESEDFHVFFLILFEIARRVNTERYPLTRDNIVNGISIAMMNWEKDGVRGHLVDMFAGNDRKGAYEKLVQIHLGLSCDSSLDASSESSDESSDHG